MAQFFDTMPLDEVLKRTVIDFPSPAPTAKGRTVLVVDDEHLIADTLVAILKGSGFSALAAYSAEGAIKLMETSVPDLLVTDVCMPGMNGIELAIYTRKHYANSKVLLFSGSATSRDLMEAAGASEYDFELLSKPVHPRDLVEHVRRCA